VQIDITGDEGDIRISNTSAFGDLGDDYVIEGAHGDNIPLQTNPIALTSSSLTRPLAGARKTASRAISRSTFRRARRRICFWPSSSGS
jgi:hypothetical protein